MWRKNCFTKSFHRWVKNVWIKKWKNESKWSDDDFFSFIEFCSTSQTCVLHLGLKSGLKCCYGGPNSDVIKHIFIVIFGDQVLIKIKVSFFVKFIIFVLTKLFWRIFLTISRITSCSSLSPRPTTWTLWHMSSRSAFESSAILSHYFCTFRIHVCVILLRFPPWQQMR